MQQWACGRVKIPQNLAVWLEKAAHFMEENPSPMRDDDDKVAVRLYRKKA